MMSVLIANPQISGFDPPQATGPDVQSTASILAVAFRAEELAILFAAGLICLRIIIFVAIVLVPWSTAK
jgi:hypothetical protein